MKVHIITVENRDHYLSEMEENYRERHRIFVDGKRWEALRRPDGRDIDEFDNDDATSLLLLKNGAVAGGLRLTPLDRPNLLDTHFARMVERALPDDRVRGADWTRFYVTSKRPERVGPSSCAAALYCAAMEYALKADLSFLTFVSTPSMIELLTSFGWIVMPLGMPQRIDGEWAVAGAISVDEAALFHVQAMSGNIGSILWDRTRDTLELPPLVPSARTIPLQRTYH